jgi:hypothetical protein
MTMTNHHLTNASQAPDLKLSTAPDGYCSPEVERTIIARIVNQTGHGSLQRDIADTTPRETEERSDATTVSTRHDLKLANHRLRLRR